MAELTEQLQAVLPSGIDIECDAQYQAMYSYKAKNYALLTQNGTMILKGAALRSRGLEPYLRSFLQSLIRLHLERNPSAIPPLYDSYAQAILNRTWPIERLAKTEALQDSLASYQKKIAAGSRNRSAAFELALQSGRDYHAGDQIAYYITGTKKKVTAYAAARLVSDWNPANRDENTAYYLGKLDEVFKKFGTPPQPEHSPIP